jgi:hypothetical protein
MAPTEYTEVCMGRRHFVDFNAARTRLIELWSKPAASALGQAFPEVKP